MTQRKVSHYHELERVYDSSPSSDVKIILGDMNAKIGTEIELEEQQKHSLHELTNKNGELLIDFATRRNMVISSTLYLSMWKQS